MKALLLLKLAEALKNPSRRLAALSMMGGALSKTPDAIKVMGKGLGTAVSFNTPDAGLGKVFSYVQNINKGATDIARLRHYRMNRVKGASATEAAANTFVASKKFKYNPKRSLKKAENALKVSDAIGSNSIKKQVSEAWNQGKRYFGIGKKPDQSTLKSK